MAVLYCSNIAQNIDWLGLGGLLFLLMTLVTEVQLQVSVIGSALLSLIDEELLLYNC